MKEFRFTYRTLLKIRLRNENTVGQQILNTRIAYQEALESLEKLVKEEGRVSDTIHAYLTQGVDSLHLLEIEQYLQEVQWLIVQQSEEIQRLEQEIAQNQKTLEQAKQQRKTMENLTEQRKPSWERDWLLEQREFMNQVTHLLYKHFKNY